MEDLGVIPEVAVQDDRALAPASSLLGLAPAWAALAGALSVATPWDGASLLRLAAVMLLVESLANLAKVRNLRKVGRVWLPYGLPDAPAGRLARVWQRTAAIWRASRWMWLAGRLASFVLAGLLLVWLGWPALWTGVALLALGRLRVGPIAARAGIGRWAAAVSAVLVPWLLAATLFGGIGPASLVCAALYTLAYAVLARDGRPAAAWPPLLAGVSQLAVLALLIVLQRPIAGAAFALGLAAQLSIQARAGAAAGLARLEPLAAAGMLLAGWTLGR